MKAAALPSVNRRVHNLFFSGIRGAELLDHAAQTAHENPVRDHQNFRQVGRDHQADVLGTTTSPVQTLGSAVATNEVIVVAPNL